MNEIKKGYQLDIGCGANKQPGYVGIDIREVPGVDFVHDLEQFPWPLEDESCVRAIASHVVEHINPSHFGFINFMNEVWRLLIYDGQFAISLPYGFSPGYIQDPTHCNPCNEATWAYFDPLSADGMLYRIYKPKPWKIQVLNWDVAGNMEVLLLKRREDVSYDG